MSETGAEKSQNFDVSNIFRFRAQMVMLAKVLLRDTT